MELNAFHIFLTVVEEMNFSRAANRLYITQQSLSGHIKRLEEHYHVRLFQRRPRLCLTPAGEAMVFYSKHILESEQAMVARFADLTQRSVGILRLGLSHQRSCSFFPGIWSRYHPEYKNISVRLQEKLTTPLLEDLLAGDIDIMLGVDIPPLSGLETVLLAQEQMRCVMNEVLLKEYFPESWQDMLERYAQNGVDLMELKEMPLILLSSPNRLRQPVDQLFRKHNAIPNIALETASHSLLYQLGCHGSGVAIANPLSLYEQIRLRGLPPKECHSFLLQGMPKRSVSLAYRKDAEKTKYMLGMVDAIVEEFDYYVEFLNRFSL